MKKAFTISVAGTVFTIEEDAYQALDAYLKSINDYFGSQADSKEIINDIEARIAEQLLDRPNKDAVVTMDDVNKLISVMGRVEDIAGESGSSSTKEHAESRTEYRGPRRLFRNPDDIWVMGVASGLGAYFGIDPLIIRIIFVILTIITGFFPMVAIYFIMAFVIPPAKTPAEKILMRGGPVDLRSFKENMNDYAENLKNQSKNFGEQVKNSSMEFAENMKRNSKEWKEQWKQKKEEWKHHGDTQNHGEKKDDFFVNSSGVHEEATTRAEYPGFVGFLRSMVRLVFKLVGFFIKLGATLCMIAVIFFFVGMIFRFHPFSALPFAAVMPWTMYYLLLVLGFLAAILPLALISMIASVIMLRPRPYLGRSALGLISTWFVVVLIGATILFSYGPRIAERIKTLPEYQIVQKSYDLKDFSKITVHNAEIVHLTQGPTFAVVAHGVQGDLDNSTFQVNGDTLTIGRTGNNFCFMCIEPQRTEIDVTVPNLTALQASGASVFDGTLVSTSSPLTLTLSGASRATLTLSVPSITVTESGASRASLDGTTTSLTAKLDGASRLEAQSLTASTTSIEAHGASRATVNASQTLDVKASGASRIYYMGSPKITQELSGASSLSQQ